MLLATPGSAAPEVGTEKLNAMDCVKPCKKKNQPTTLWIKN